MILGLSGYARSGKDTAASVLVDEFGFTRIAFADKLREVLLAINPKVAEEIVEDDIFSEEREDPIKTVKSVYTARVSDVIEYHGWDGYKETVYNDEIRGLLQRLGTEAGRNILGPNIWVDTALRSLEPDGKYVVTDMRFPNEFAAVKERGGTTWRINRQGIGPAVAPDGTVHPSETSLDDHQFDRVIANDVNFLKFKDKIRLIAMEERL